MAAHEGAEVADPGLARRPAPVRAEVGNGVIDIDGTAHSGGVWEYISRVTQQELFTQSCRDFVAIDWDVTGRQIDHRFHVDRAALPEQHLQSAQQHRTDVFDPGDTAASGDRFGAEVHIDHAKGPRPIRIKRRRHDL